MSTISNNAVAARPIVLTDIRWFLFSLGIGIGMGIASFSNAIIAVLYGCYGIILIYLAVRSDVKGVFSTIPFFIYAEIYFRASGSILPYLFCPYILLAVFILLLAKKGTTFKVYSRSFVLLFLFDIVEIFNSLKTENPNVARSLITHTSLLFIVSLWSCSTIITPALINVFIKSVKMAGLWLCGYILAAHITGHIKYELVSSFDSTNGLAPVQISAYLGLLSFLFFLSVVNNAEPKKIFTNVCFLILSATLMVLSFSRGGLYFIGILVTLYFVFNAKKMSNYYMILLLIPVASLIYYYVGATTNGLVGQRYAEEGASGRDRLVEIGWQLFLRNPVTGIGTGNFNTAIIKEHLYEEQSGAHNEFIRVLAEHGFLGLATYWVFYISLFVEIIRAKGIRREYAFYFLVLFCLIIVHNGLKIGLQSMILMMAIVITHSFVKNKPTAT